MSDRHKRQAGDGVPGRRLVRMLLIDDQPVFRLGLRFYLGQAMPEVELVAEAATEAEGLAEADQCEPDMILLDASLGGCPAARLVSRLRELRPGCRIVLLVGRPDDEALTVMMSAPADAYALKTAPPQLLVKGLRHVLNGGTWVQPEVSRAIAASTGAYGPGPQRLTGRQMQVLRLIVLGQRNAQIADHLAISQETVKSHVATLLRRLGARNRLQAAHIAVRAGLVSVT